MLEALATAIATPGLVWVVAVTAIAGVVYGFAGFGSALIFMPLATIFLPPPVAIGAFSLSALGSLATVVPRAWPVADKRATGALLLAFTLFMPLGIFLLRTAPEDAIRTAVCVLTLLTLAALLSGWRVPLRGSGALRLGVGALAGVTGGATGLNGPPVILFNLGSDQSVAVTRANLACFLTLSSLVMLPMLWLQGLIDASAAVLGLLLVGPYAAGGYVGGRLFRPEAAGTYKGVAYILIGAAGVMGLPVWG